MLQVFYLDVANGSNSQVAWRLRNLDTHVNLNNVGYKDDMWVLADRVAHVLYYALENPNEHVVISGKQRILGVDGI
jgi:hypothetical protein